MKKRKISFNNPWFVTLISTMFGIIAGLYITNHFENKRLLNAKENALQQVENELKDNAKLLTTFHTQIDTKFAPVRYLLANINEAKELIISKDSLETFKHNTASVFEFKKAEKVSDSLLKIRGDFNFTFQAELMGKNLSSIIWNSYKQTDYLSITRFECLTNVETYYVMQEEVNTETIQWKNTLYQGAFMGSSLKTEKFISQWQSLYIKQKLLLEYYSVIDDVLSDCK
ncbi:hypothetical protein [Kordia jejudonensis]|uniref:hypothetical protein n=1 Tax=Kordia jejudonensis TaxID=1348245 RepID=UPI0006295A5F|nr:hypothetical protein [Kordia jejudonensis]